MATHYRPKTEDTKAIRKTISLSDSLVAALDKHAQAKGISFSFLCQRVLENYLKKTRP